MKKSRTTNRALLQLRTANNFEDQTNMTRKMFGNKQITSKPSTLGILLLQSTRSLLALAITQTGHHNLPLAQHIIFESSYSF